MSILIGVVGLTYSNVLSHDFVWDDYSFILEWPQLDQFWLHISDFFAGNVPEGHEGLYRPIRSILYGLAFQIWGTQAWGYHLQGIVIQALGTILMYFLVKLITHQSLPAFMAGVIFAVHPVHVEAITWITPNLDIVGVLWAVLAIYLHIKFTLHRRITYFWGALLFSTLAYFTNEITLVLPGIVAWYDLCFSSKKSLKKIVFANYRFWLGLLVPAVIYLSIRFFYLDIGARETYLFNSVYVTGLLMSVAAVKQIILMIWPYPLTVNHTILDGFTALFYHEYNLQNPPLPPKITQPEVFISIISLIFLIRLVYTKRRRYPVLAFLGGWHFLAVLPLMQIVPQSIIFGERYLYFASFGSIAFLVVLVQRLLQKVWPVQAKPAFIGLVAGWAIILGWVSYQRNFDWQNSQTLWESTLAVGPRTPYALSNLAKFYYEAGDPDQARNLLEESYQLNPNHLIAVSNLGLLYSLAGQYDKAIDLHLHIYDLAPEYTPNIEKLGVAYLKKLDYLNAIHWYGLYRQLRPHDPMAQLKLASAFHTAFIFDRAEIEYLHALEMDPNNPLIYWQLAELYKMWARDDEAAQMLDKVKALDPNFSKTSAYDLFNQELE